MGRNDIVEGHASFKEFFYWINERHQVYCNRKAGKPWPWTTDPILQKFKFTNCFRQLDTGTVALRKLIFENYISDVTRPSLLIYNVIWYRMFNWIENAFWAKSHQEVVTKICQRYNTGRKVFTCAHLHWGKAGIKKHISTLETLEKVWAEREELAEYAATHHTMEAMFNRLKAYRGIGDFISYEMVCDLRFTNLLTATDRFTWTNLGPGCKRGLRRLGLPVEIESLIQLFEMATSSSGACEPTPACQPHVLNAPTTPPFELREIEHSLCEFDKYMRVKTGVGRPRQRFIPPYERD